MAVYYKINCPHCGNVVESGKDKHIQYGSPLRKCKKCGEEYVDDNYIEAATQNIETVYEKEFSWGSLVYIAIGVLFLFMGISEVYILLIVIGAGALILGVVSFISNIKYKPKEDPALQREIIASQKRLENPYYVLALNKANIYVPQEVLEKAKKKISEEQEQKENTSKQEVDLTEETNQIIETNSKFDEKKFWEKR